MYCRHDLIVLLSCVNYVPPETYVRKHLSRYILLEVTFKVCLQSRHETSIVFQGRQRASHDVLYRKNSLVALGLIA